MSNESDEHVYFDNVQINHTRGRITEENHYYAYGLKIAGISSKKLADLNEGLVKNNYLYNDKELWDEGDLNWYDYGFRNYDPQIGRFTQLDPLTNEYPELTNYQYASNDPITNIDIDGLEGGLSTIGAATNAAAGFGKAAGSLSKVLSIASIGINVGKLGVSIADKSGDLYLEYNANAIADPQKNDPDIQKSKGRLTINNKDGKIAKDKDGDLDFDAVSGGDKETNGTLPDGYYRVKIKTKAKKYGEDSDQGNDVAFTDENGYFFKLQLDKIDEKAYDQNGKVKIIPAKKGSGFNRTDLLIHPTSGGTFGCIGLTCSTLNKQRFYGTVVSYMQANGGYIILKARIQGINGRASVQKGELYKK